ncbi:hypothetical protein P3T37_006139 [Kitasatospora sp. MAA4]|uniref:nucleotide-binding protein n=1 Tax=Kitasatospora sp. MAA4 TaxID=3035093 RepID=UPI00247650F8|nr:nucleotide-binding protein [Kitasatospora sp. MAA4]MDH6136708.1 hypothetical protein [Kitasatospora sp. MAA4]
MTSIGGNAVPTEMRVAVVHGRNDAARSALFTKLRDFQLRPVEWDEAVAEAGVATPFTFTVVQQLFERVQAVVVLMTPDDEARLRAHLRKPSDKQSEKQLTGQPRPNVLIEAGMAFAHYPDRTVLVEIGAMELPSDFQGMNTVRIDGTAESVHRLASRLRDSARCAVVTGPGVQWLDTREFKTVLEAMRRDDEAQVDPLLEKNARGVTLYDALAGAGIVDIELRTEAGAPTLPPTQFYNRAQREIAISCVSCHSTLVQHVDVIEDVLAAGREFYVLLLSPDSEELPRINQREAHSVRGDIQTVIDTVKIHGLHKRPGFSMRFAPRLPPFTAVMIDGDLSPTGDRPADAGAEIRVQPGVVHGTQHQGPVLQLVKSKKGAFDYFAADFRKQWESAAVRRDLFEGS